MQAEVLVHRPVLAEESPRLLVTDPNGVYVDGTFGRGGHSRLILEKLSPQGRLIAFDRDEEAVKAAAQIKDPRFQIIHAPFASMKEELAKVGIDRVSGIFLDIGVSSPQIDTRNADSLSVLTALWICAWTQAPGRRPPNGSLAQTPPRWLRYLKISEKSVSQ